MFVKTAPSSKQDRAYTILFIFPYLRVHIYMYLYTCNSDFSELHVYMSHIKKHVIFSNTLIEKSPDFFLSFVGDCDQGMFGVFFLLHRLVIQYSTTQSQLNKRSQATGECLVID